MPCIYVSLYGDDNHDGQAEQNPVRTVHKGLQLVTRLQAERPTLKFLKPGTYDAVNMSTARGIIVDGNIGGGQRAPVPSVYLGGNTHDIVITGLQVIGCQGNGILNKGHRNVIQDCIIARATRYGILDASEDGATYTHLLVEANGCDSSPANARTGDGILIQGENVTVSDSVIRHNGQDGLSPPSFKHGIYVNVDARNFTIVRNQIYGNRACGVKLRAQGVVAENKIVGGSGGIAIGNITGPTTIKQNILLMPEESQQVIKVIKDPLPGHDVKDVCSGSGKCVSFEHNAYGMRPTFMSQFSGGNMDISAWQKHTGQDQGANIGTRIYQWGL
ncbi:hypothetical protein BZG36_01012 [Bifiguratus adelaidae]|uniref:Right handed beta helix domain-containing protein n=1 Tax=Bifiguratus adelaidae TaxID=1938954 RepID=A0A261Y698_9FUNG|nr:hypothetical protein BZG36_01012 [Bifiguratus adelaidae]